MKRSTIVLMMVLAAMVVLYGCDRPTSESVISEGWLTSTRHYVTYQADASTRCTSVKTTALFGDTNLHCWIQARDYYE